MPKSYDKEIQDGVLFGIINLGCWILLEICDVAAVIPVIDHNLPTKQRPFATTKAARTFTMIRIMRLFDCRVVLPSVFQALK